MHRPAWLLVPAVLAAQTDLSTWQTVGGAAETRHEGCRLGSCTVLLPPPAGSPPPFGTLRQVLDASTFRGRRVFLSAWIRVESAGPHAAAQMFLRVLRPGGQWGFYDDMGDRPIVSTNWQHYEIAGEVAEDAESVEAGVLSFGQARVWIDDLRLARGPTPTPAEAAIRREIEGLYARIDAAYAHGDVSEISRLAMPDAKIVFKQGPAPLAGALADIAGQIRRGTRIQSHSSVTGLQMAGGEAVVFVNNDSLLNGADSLELLSINRDTWMPAAGGGWRLAETVLISTRSLTPRTDAETAAVVAQELKQRAAALDETAADSPGLTAFGNAVGDARIVALGEATHGTREFYTLNQRLFEYLVRHKGFTVLAIEANWPEAAAVDRYVKTGEGDPRKALAGMNFWTWYTEEMLAIVEWMRAYNQAPGPHPTLTFTSFDMQAGHGAAEIALEYLKEYAPDFAGVAQSIFAEAYDVEIFHGDPDDSRAEAVAAKVAQVAHEFDLRHRELTAASGEEKWRDARQAAAVVLESCSFRVPGKSAKVREESMAANAGWIAGSQFPREKVVLWAHNAHVRAESDPKSMGQFLRERFGRQLYVVGYAFRRGGLRAKGPRGGTAADVANFEAPPSPEGSGDAVLSGAGIPLFFLDFAGVPAGTPLARWLDQPHLFHSVGSNWPADDPAASLDPGVARRRYDGLIFVEQGHAARPL